MDLLKEVSQSHQLIMITEYWFKYCINSVQYPIFIEDISPLNKCNSNSQSHAVPGFGGETVCCCYTLGCLGDS